MVWEKHMEGFQLVSDNFAVIALHDKELRKIAGIRKGLFYRWRKLFCFCSPRTHTEGIRNPIADRIREHYG
ncbi:hypothetical protein ES703_39418 [subsurface metagenome]